jgi:heme/copper-type cytochrome/quinol oxidase subunit 3
MTTHTEHETQGHHEAPEVVEHRQRLGIWIFIAGDAVGLGALLFTYLYLRGTNTGGHWRTILGYFLPGVSSADAETYAGAHAPTMQYEHTMSAGFNWLITGVIIASALVFWLGEKQLRSKVGATNKGVFGLATLVAIGAIVLQVIQIRHVPQYWVAENDSQLFAFTSYGSAMLALGVSSLIHLVLLAFFGFGVEVRAVRGVVSSEKWYHVRFVRLFWVWIAVSAIITSVVTTFLH